MSEPTRPLDALEETIRQREASLHEPTGEETEKPSYTARLLTKGAAKIGSKVTEEAAELVEAATEPGDEGRLHFIYEAGDLLYHMLVLLRWRGVDLAEVEAELAKRFGTSGIEEKESRKKKKN